MKIAFTGCGSVGHLAPLVAVWRAIEKEYPKAEAMFLCSDRPADMDYLRAEAVPFHALPTLRRNLRMPLTMARDYGEAKRLFREWKPDVILSKAGGITVPVCFAAKRMGIPIVVHESDSVPGNGTRMIGRWATEICWGFPGMKMTTGIHTGNPVRPDIACGSKKRGLTMTGLSGARPVLLVLGGSQGATAINEAITRHLDELLTFCDIVHITGPGKRGATQRKGYWSTDIVYDGLPDILALADVVLSRAGAGSIGELSACGIPTILCPLTGVGHDHQRKNAEAVAAMGACTLLDQSRIDAEIVTSVRQFMEDPVKAKKTGKALQSLHTPSASGHIAKVMVGCIAGGRPRT